MPPLEHTTNLQAARKQASDRIEIRSKPGQKQLFEQAASLEGQTLSEFLLRSGEDHAQRVLQYHEEMKLQADAASRFLDLLTSPPPPTARLRAALNRYDREIESR